MCFVDGLAGHILEWACQKIARVVFRIDIFESFGFVFAKIVSKVVCIFLVKIFLPFVRKLSLSDTVIFVSLVDRVALDVWLLYERKLLFLSVLFWDLGIEPITIDNFLLSLLVTTIFLHFEEHIVAYSMICFSVRITTIYKLPVYFIPQPILAYFFLIHLFETVLLHQQCFLVCCWFTLISELLFLLAGLEFLALIKYSSMRKYAIHLLGNNFVLSLSSYDTLNFVFGFGKSRDEILGSKGVGFILHAVEC